MSNIENGYLFGKIPLYYVKTIIREMKNNLALILKICGGITTVFAAGTVLFGIFRFVENTKKTNETQVQIIQSQDSIKRMVVKIYDDVQDIKGEFSLFQQEVTREINSHERSYKEFLIRYANLNTEQYATLTEGIRGLQEDLKKNSYRTPLVQDE